MIYANEHMVDLLNEQYKKVEELTLEILRLKKEVKELNNELKTVLEECDCE